MSTLLSLHYIPTHGRPEDLAYTRALQPNVLKTVDADPGQARAVHEAAPEAWVCLRDWALSEQKGDMRADPVATGKRHAREWADKLKRYDFLPRDRLLVCGINEPEVWLDFTVVPYTVAYLDALAAYGIKGLALNLSVGWPANAGEGTPPDWGPYAEVEPAIKRGGHWLGLHEYWDERGPEYNWGWWAGRYTRCPWQVPILIGECGLDKYVADTSVGPHRRGWQAWLGAEQYAAQLRRYAERCAQDKRLRGLCVFTTDYGNPWQSFDTAPAATQLAAIQIPPASAGTPGAEPPPTRPPTEPPPASGLAHPCLGAVLTQHWGQNPGNYAQFGLWGHNGTDLAAPTGTAVRALADGIVAWADTDPNYGEYVRLHHPELKADSFYAHLSRRDVAAGQAVRAGDAIGRVGSTGNSTGPHLHLEIRLREGDGYRRGTPMPKGRIDPESFCIERGLVL